MKQRFCDSECEPQAREGKIKDTYVFPGREKGRDSTEEKAWRERRIVSFEISEQGVSFTLKTMLLQNLHHSCADCPVVDMVRDSTTIKR